MVQNTMTDMTSTRPVLRYHGGKWRLAPWLISQMPEHRLYVEPFGGAASVLLRKPRAAGEIYNDLDSEVVSLFRILRDKKRAKELQRRLALTPFSREEFIAAYDPPVDEMDGAWKMVIRSFMGFSTDTATRKVRSGFRTNKTKGKTPAREWATYSDSIPRFVDRLRGVTIENRNAFEVIASYDTPDTFFFVDPPYVLSTRGHDRGKHGYRHEMGDQDHRMLALLLHGLKGKVLLCGYWCRLYEDLYADWKSTAVKCYANGCHERAEHTWRNYDSAELQGQTVSEVRITDVFEQPHEALLFR